MSYALDAFCRSDDVEEIVRASLAELLSRDLSRRIDEAWAANLAAPVAVTVAMHKLRTVVNLAVYPLDGKLPSQETLEVRAPDREPAPPSIDAWARGVVPTRQKSAADDVRFMKRAGTAESGTFSVTSSFRSRKSGASGAASNKNGLRPLSNGAAPGSARPDRASSAKATDDASSEHTAEDRPSSSRAGGDKTEQYKRMQKLLNRHGSGNRSMSAGKDEFQKLQEEIEAARKAMKGMRFAIDSNGRTVPITDAQPDSLPRVTVPMSATITSFQESAAREDIPEINRVAPKKGAAPKSSKASVGPSFTPSTSLATVLSENIDDSFRLNPGVSVVTGVSVREGPPAPADPLRASRRKLESSDAASLASTASVQEHVDGSESVVSNNLTAHSTISSRLADLDPMEGGKPKLKNTNTTKILTDKDLGLGPVSSTVKSNPNSITLPAKASSKPQRELAKEGRAGPRDRAAPTSSMPTADRKKLPPPELGKTTGHGIVDGASAAGSKGSPINRNGGPLDSFSIAGDNSTILTGSILSTKSKRDGGSIKLTDVELAKELY